MIVATLTSIAAEVSPLLTAASDDSGSGWLLALGPAGGGAVYFGLWRYYRNTHVSHGFERETRITAQPVTGDDVKVDTVTGTKRRRINGDNVDDHRRRVERS